MSTYLVWKTIDIIFQGRTAFCKWWNRNEQIQWRRNLTHWGRVTHICVGKLTTIGPHTGLSPDRRQAIIWTSAGILLIGPLGTNFSEILIEIRTFSFKKMRLKVSSAKRRRFCFGLNELMLSEISSAPSVGAVWSSMVLSVINKCHFSHCELAWNAIHEISKWLG